MDVFGVHRTLIKDSRSFTEGGTVIRDDRIAAFVEDDLNSKSQWPDPRLSLNVVVDAPFRHKVAEEERAAVDSALGAGDLIQPPAGTEGKGDALVTAIAEDTGRNRRHQRQPCRVAEQTSLVAGQGTSARSHLVAR
ncbi:hypothetical protein ACF06V_05460 [Streptomyces bobili]|uniref:hypothetical protein n=1 Tax=Streptomyces bobili TaxID=67280 RepID=UPI0036FEEF6F